MPLREIYSRLPETISERAIAAKNRYNEGRHLAQHDFGGAAIYLIGFSVEMVLKNAYFRTKGIQEAAGIREDLSAAQYEAKLLRVSVPHEGFHNLVFWADLLVKRRRSEGKSLIPDLERELLVKAQRMSLHWWPGMRYRNVVPKASEVKMIIDDASWFLRYEALLGGKDGHH